MLFDVFFCVQWISYGFSFTFSVIELTINLFQALIFQTFFVLLLTVMVDKVSREIFIGLLVNWLIWLLQSCQICISLCLHCCQILRDSLLISQIQIFQKRNLEPVSLKLVLFSKFAITLSIFIVKRKLCFFKEQIYCWLKSQGLAPDPKCKFNTSSFLTLLPQLYCLISV